MADLSLKKPLPVGPAGTHSSGWHGVVTLIVTESALFVFLLFSYWYSYLQVGTHWPPEGHPKLGMGGLNTTILISSSGFVWLAEHFLKKRHKRASLAMLAIAILLGAIFVGIQLKEWKEKGYGPTTHLYGSLFYTITGFHMAHVVIGLVMLSFLWLWTLLGYYDHRRFAGLTIGGLYWHFVDAVWLFVFSTFYLMPYLK